MAEPEPAAKRQRKVTPGDETVFNLSNNRRVTVREFRGKTLIDIREYYTDAAGDLKPGKKGLSLTVEQYEKFLELIPKINEILGLEDTPATKKEDESKEYDYE